MISNKSMTAPSRTKGDARNHLIRVDGERVTYYMPATNLLAWIDDNAECGADREKLLSAIREFGDRRR